jgi:sugar lactone lactonase YvrE
MGLALDAEGNLYVADWGNNRVRKISPGGSITTVAGNGIEGFEGDDGPAASAQLIRPRLIATDSQGNLYIAAQWGRLRKVSPDGIITTVAGNGTYGYSGDNGPATSARIGSINGLAVDVAGNVYIVDINIIDDDAVYEEYSRVRKISTDGTITTLAGGPAGYSGDDGPAEHARISSSASLSVDATGNVFLADGPRIRKISPDGTITTVAGTGVPGYSLEDGPALTTQLGFVQTLTTSPAKDIFFVDGNARIRKLTPGGKIATVAGYTTPAGVTPPMGDGGPAADAQLAAPVGVAVDEAGTVYVADTWAFRVRAIGTDGIIRTVAGTGAAGEPVGDGEAATSARVLWPAGLTFDRNGTLFLADAGNHRVRSISRQGMITTVAGWGPIGVAGFLGDGGRATEARLSWPKDVAIDSAGNLYVADTGNNRVRVVTPSGVISTLVGEETATQLNLPSGLAIDGLGNIYISDTENYRIRRVSRDGIVTTVAGTGTRGHSGDNGPAIQAQLNYPTGLKFDRAGNLYIADGASVRRVTANGTISTVAGTGVLGYSGDGGPARAAMLGAWGLAFDNSGNLYVADPWNAVIRVLKPAQ